MQQVLGGIACTKYYLLCRKHIVGIHAEVKEIDFQNKYYNIQMRADRLHEKLPIENQTQSVSTSN